MKNHIALALVTMMVSLAYACEGSGQDDGQFVREDKSSVSPEITPVDESLTPPLLTWDFYPNGLDRSLLLSNLAGAVDKSGHIRNDETWSGVVHVTGDVHVDDGVTLTIEAGTHVLVAARTDDQSDGEQAPLDQFNPKDPRYDGRNRTGFHVHGSLIIEGTRRNPVIITSDAEHPLNDDWGPFGLNPGDDSTVRIARAIVEFTRTIGIGASNIEIRQSILRNMMECVVIGQDMCRITPETALNLTPVLTQNHIYNTGRHAVTVRNGAPAITHNVIRARPDMTTTGWEQGAIGMDFPSCAQIQYNYLDGGQPHLYRGEIFGTHYEYTQPKSAGARGMCSFLFSHNTLTGSPIGLESHAGDWSIEYNNFLPISASDADAAEGWPNFATLALVVNDGRPEPSDTCQFAFLEQIGGAPIVETLSARNNYWGTPNPEGIARLIESHVPGLTIEYEPFAEDFITDALPDWREFEW